jgi:nitrile hydratase
MSADAIFAPGARVTILDLGKPGHVRTPLYVRGKTGVIDHYCGAFENPEERAYGRLGRGHVPLYRVRLRQCDLWPGYDGDAADTLVLEIYHHWLRPA